MIMWVTGALHVKDCCWRVAFRQTLRKPSLESIYRVKFVENSYPSPGFLNFQLTKNNHLTVIMASAQVLETSATNSSPSQGYSPPDYQFQSKNIF